MASSSDSGPSDEKNFPVERHFAQKSGSELTQPLEPVASWESEDTPSVDDSISSDADVCGWPFVKSPWNPADGI
jgi:hypothetical protein